MRPPDTKERPGVGTGATRRSVVGTEASGLTLQPATDLIAARRRWAYRLVRRTTTPAPLYGSQKWLQLPEGDPAKVAAVVNAAECWAQAGDDLETELRRELDAARPAHKQAEDAEYQARAEAHRSEWSRRPPSGPTFLERRAEQLLAAGGELRMCPDGCAPAGCWRVADGTGLPGAGVECRPRPRPSAQRRGAGA